MTATGQGALAGLRVLDCSRFIAGPYCGMLLGDLGADVVKVERPQGGDEARSFGPAMGRPDLLEHPDFAAQEARVKHVDAVEQVTADWVAGHTADEIVDLLGQAGVPAARVASIAEVADNPQLRHRGRIASVDHPSVGALPTVGPVIGLSESPAAIRRPAPRLGEHTDEVLRDWLDLPPERIAALRARGAIS